MELSMLVQGMPPSFDGGAGDCSVDFEQERMVQDTRIIENDFGTNDREHSLQLAELAYRAPFNMFLSETLAMVTPLCTSHAIMV